MAASASERGLQLRDAPVEAALGELLPARTREVTPFLDGLRDGRLLLRRCGRCERTRTPSAPICPHCGHDGSAWSEVDGGGSVRSWIRYQRAFLVAFEPLVPYVVLTVQLDDGGARLFGRLAGEPTEPREGMRVRAIVERWADGACMLAFAPEEEDR